MKEDYSRRMYKDYYYKYKALKYFFKNQNLKRGGSDSDIDSDMTINSDITDDFQSVVQPTTGLQLPNEYKDKFLPGELEAINEEDNDKFLENIFQNMSKDLQQDKEFLADLVNTKKDLIRFISKDIIKEKEFFDKIYNVAEVFSQNNISIPYKDLEKTQLIELIKGDINILSINEVQTREDYTTIINNVVADIHPAALLIRPDLIDQENKISVLKKYPALLKFLPEQNNDKDFIKRLIFMASENYNPEKEKLKNDLEKEKRKLEELEAYKFRYNNDMEIFKEMKRTNEEKIENLEKQLQELNNK